MVQRMVTELHNTDVDDLYLEADLSHKKMFISRLDFLPAYADAS